MIDFLRTLHSHNRWIVVVLALACIVKLMMNVIRRSDFSVIDAKLLRFYALFLTIQLTIGVVLFVNFGTENNWSMTQLRLQLEHAVTMILAVGLAHATSGLKRREASQRTMRGLIFVLASFVLVIAGVARLKGLNFWIGG